MFLSRSIVPALFLVTACAGGATEAAAPSPAGAPPADVAPASDPAAAEAARQAAVADSTRSAYTPADVGFMAGMIHHHAQALTMSRMADDHGASDPLRILAARIINAQRDEIRLMQDWLRARGEAVPDPPEMRADVAEEGTPPAGERTPPAGADAPPAEHPAGHGQQHGEHAGHGEGGEHAPMPGMLTPDQLAALDAAHGEDWDRLFLQLMIQHHEGALTMVEELFATHGAAQEDAVFKLASDIGADQSSEITRMRAMLAEMIVAEDP